MNCGGRKLRKRRRGPMRGMYVCSCCGPIAPRAEAMAYRWGIPVELWILIHRRSVDERADMNKIAAEMYQDYLAGRLNEQIAAERDRRNCKYDPDGLDDFEVPTAIARPKVVWRSKGGGVEASEDRMPALWQADYCPAI